MGMLKYEIPKKKTRMQKFIWLHKKENEEKM